MVRLASTCRLSVSPGQRWRSRRMLGGNISRFPRRNVPRCLYICDVRFWRVAHIPTGTRPPHINALQQQTMYSLCRFSHCAMQTPETKWSSMKHSPQLSTSESSRFPNQFNYISSFIVTTRKNLRPHLERPMQRVSSQWLKRHILTQWGCGNRRGYSYIDINGKVHTLVSNVSALKNCSLIKFKDKTIEQLNSLITISLRSLITLHSLSPS